MITTEQASSSTTGPLISIAAIRIASTSTAAQALQHDNKNDLMVDSGAVTHVCPPWFSTETTLHELHQPETPNLRTATDDAIKVYGYKWVYMINNKNQAIVIPFYICDVAQPILSATRLAEQGFEITLSEQPTFRHTNDSNQHWSNNMAYTTWQRRQQEHQSTHDRIQQKQSKALKQQSHQSRWLQQESSGWHTTTTFGFTTAKVSYTRGNDKQHTYLTNNVQFQWTSLKTTGEQ